MKIGIIYYTRSGNTRKAAEILDKISKKETFFSQ
jgi:flavodoxin